VKDVYLLIAECAECGNPVMLSVTEDLNFHPWSTCLHLVPENVDSWEFEGLEEGLFVSAELEE